MKTTLNVHGRRSLVLLTLVLASASSCATTTPVELVNARTAYSRASGGQAAQLAPADLHTAKAALDKAEQSLSYGDDPQATIDFAYVAERDAQIAEAHAATAVAEKKTDKAKNEFEHDQTAITKSAQADLVKTRDQLTEAERAQALQTQAAGNERSAREEADRKAAASEQKAVVSDLKATAAEQKAADANAALAALAAKEEERGTVITLSGSVLFRSNDSTLLPGAMTRLDQVAAALVTKNRPVVVEGYTDSKGSQSTNMNLSRMRAESVRSYLVTRGVPTDKIVAQGMGPDRPIADNSSAEGRANNRRVEIVIAKQ